jgi:glycine dehydrogenase subunit 2
MLGIVRPGDVGVDALHVNLHKTFATPHGGGGPGSGPVLVKSHLAPFLPKPTVIKGNDNDYRLNWDMPQSIGKLQAFWGAFGVMVKAYAYILTMGADGLRKVSEDAVLNSNYLLALLKDYYELPFKGTPMHECVFSGEPLKKFGIKTLDVAKRLLDFGYHAPTIYFPLIVHEAIMIEPTETEPKEVLDAFADAMIRIRKEAEENPSVLQHAPTITPVRRLDDVAANKAPVLKWADVK